MREQNPLDPNNPNQRRHLDILHGGDGSHVDIGHAPILMSRSPEKYFQKIS
jgi:hypothetical protein